MCSAHLVRQLWGPLVLSMLVAVWLQESRPVHAGGAISGKVTYTGKSEEKEFVFSKFPNPQFCPKIPKQELVRGDKRILPTITVAKAQGLAAAVIAITDMTDQAFIDGYRGTEVVAEFCEFLPYMGVVVKQKNFHVENRDADPEDPKSAKGVLHNPHSFEVKGPTSTTIFNIALAERGATLTKPVVLRKPESFMRLQCDQHEFMQSFFFPVTNGHYAVAKGDGSFELNDVPAGKHRLIAWHPFAGQTELDVEVLEGSTTQANLTVKKK